MNKNYRLKVDPSRVPDEVTLINFLAAESGNPVLMFAVVLRVATYYVFNINRQEYIKQELAEEILMEYISKVGPDKFVEEFNEVSIDYLKKQGIHVVDISGQNPRNN